MSARMLAFLTVLRASRSAGAPRRTIEGKATRRAAAGYDRAVPEMSGGGDRRRDHQHPALDPRTPTAPLGRKPGGVFFCAGARVTAAGMRGFPGH
jgi:hypothetical protein